jgi:DNA-binding transcriptional LysR family regulator
MEMHQVRYFLAVARELNFTRAADECHVSQPSLTRAIQKLEEELGGPLFRRERSRTHLTDLGRLMLPHLERTFEAAEAAKSLAQGVSRSEVAPLALGVQSIVESDTLCAILRELAQGLKGFELKLSTGSAEALLEQALSGDLDLIIIEAPDELPARVDHWPLFRHGYVMVTRPDHPLTRGQVASLDALRDEHWIDHDGAGCPRLRSAAAAIGFEPLVRHQASDLLQLSRLVGAGVGSAFIPPLGANPSLVAIPLVDAQVSVGVILGAVAGRRRGGAAEAFVRASRARSWSDVGS